MKKIEYKGYSCLYVPFHGNTSNVRIVVGAGSSMETPNVYGVAHFLEHMFFKDCKTMNSKQIRDRLSYLSSSNAYTTNLRTVYTADVLNENVGNMLNMYGEVFFHPEFIQDEMNKERGVIFEEYQMYMDDPFSYFYENVEEYTFGEVGHKIVGTKETLANLTTKDLQDFVNKHYNKQRTLFVVITPNNYDDVKKDFINMIDKWSVDRNGEVYYEPQGTLIENGCLNITHSAEQSMFAIIRNGYNSIESKENKHVDVVFNNAFGGDFHSILFDRIREKKGLCYTVAAKKEKIGKNARNVVFTMLKKENIETAMNEIDKCFNEVLNGSFSEELLDISKKNILLSSALATSTPDKIGMSNVDFYFENGVWEFDKFKQRIESVTIKNVTEYVEWLASSPKQTIIMNGDE